MHARLGRFGSRGAALALLAVVLLLLGLGAFSVPALPPADFVFVNGSDVETFDPAQATGVREGRILRALGEGLVRPDPRSLRPLPGVARKWQRSEDGREFVFELREDAAWSNGDPLVAADFVRSFRRLLAPATASPSAHLLFAVQGAQEFHGGAPRDRKPGLGIRAEGPHRLRIRLARRDPGFLARLMAPALMPVHGPSLDPAVREGGARWEALWARPDRLVTNGPYRLELRRLGDRIRLRKNEHYWDADEVAFACVDALSIEHGGTALNLYLTGEVHWLDGNLPPELVPDLVRREDFRSAPYLGTYFLRVNTTVPPLDNPLVRRALSMTIDRATICRDVLRAGQAPTRTLIPWGRLGPYKSPDLPEPRLNIARRLLLEAGIDTNVRPFSVELLYNNGESHREIAQVIAAGWRRLLGAKVRLRNQEWKSYLDAQRRLAYEISRSSWIADVRDPIDFLQVFRSDDPNNRTGWSNAEYDRKLHEAEREPRLAERNRLLAEAEKILLDEAPILPVYSYVSQNLAHPRLGGLESNEQNEVLLSNLYWRDDAELARARQAAIAALPAKSRVLPRRVPPPGPRAGLYSPAERRRREGRR